MKYLCVDCESITEFSPKRGRTYHQHTNYYSSLMLKMKIVSQGQTMPAYMYGSFCNSGSQKRTEKEDSKASAEM